MDFYTNITLQDGTRLLGADYNDLQNAPIQNVGGVEIIVIKDLECGTYNINGIVRYNMFDEDQYVWENRVITVEKDTQTEEKSVRWVIMRGGVPIIKAIIFSGETMKEIEIDPTLIECGNFNL